MIGFMSLGTNNLEQAIDFYDKLLAPMNASEMFTTEDMKGWEFGPNTSGLSVAKPFDKMPATVGNGVMVALALPNKEAVDKMHALALSLGATDEGAAGERSPGFYVAYFRDLDGNKLNFFHWAKANS